jgi:RHS repeat-associated protein
VPPGRAAHSFTYPLGMMKYYIPPNVTPTALTQPRTEYGYNLDGQMTRITRPDTQQIFLAYDIETGQLTTQTTPSGTTTFGYNEGTGNLETISAPGSVGLAYTYDGQLPKSETWSGPVSGSVSRTYQDKSLRLGTLSVNGANPITFEYDKDDLLTQAGALTLTRHTQNGLITGTTITDSGHTVTDTSGYNSFGEIEHYEAKYGTTEFLDFYYVRDSLGRITSVTEELTLPGTSTVTTARHYKFDDAGRLWKVCTSDSCTTLTTLSQYEFDDNGNVISDGTNTSKSVTQGAIDGDYDEQDRLITATHGVVTIAYEYTANGELTKKSVGSSCPDSPCDVTTYEYDVLGNLRHVELPNSDEIDYVIDGRNRCIGKKVNHTLTQAWLYQDQLEPVAELDGSGNVVSRFIYGSNAHVPDYMIKGGVEYRIISDHLESVRLVVKVSDGTVAQLLAYDEYGVVTTDTVPGFQPFAYTGGLYDQDTGLTRFGARDYDPTIGRWTAKDPARFGGGPNLYAYVGSDPVNLFDLTGLYSLSESQFVAGLQNIMNKSVNFQITRKVRNKAVCFAVEEVVDQAIEYGLYIALGEVGGALYGGQSVAGITNRIKNHAQVQGARLASSIRVVGEGVPSQIINEGEQFIIDFLKRAAGFPGAPLAGKGGVGGNGLGAVLNKREQIRKLVGQIDICD